jgi:hypothetical protein
MKGAALRFILISSAFLSVFFFPYPFTLFLSFIASVFVPWVAFIIGITQDALFMVPHEGRIPTATLLGAVASITALVVRRFVKARII